MGKTIFFFMLVATVGVAAACEPSDPSLVDQFPEATGGSGSTDDTDDAQGAGGETGGAGESGQGGAGGDAGAGNPWDDWDGLGGRGGFIGPIAFLQVTADRPDLYGSLILDFDGIRVVPEHVVPDDCSGESRVVFGIPLGDRAFKVKSSAGFWWEASANLQDENECQHLDLLVDDIVSHLYFRGVNTHMRGRSDVPTFFSIDGAYVGRVTKHISLEEIDEHPSIRDSLYGALFDFVVDGALFVWPANEGDPPRLLRDENDGGWGSETVTWPSFWGPVSIGITTTG